MILTCLCCPQRREIHRDAADDEWGHLDDGTYAETAHVHVSEEMTGRDRSRGGSVWCELPNPGESREDLWARVVRGAVAAYASGRLEVTVEGSRRAFAWVADDGDCITRRHGSLCTDPGCVELEEDDGPDFDDFFDEEEDPLGVTFAAQEEAALTL